MESKSSKFDEIEKKESEILAKECDEDFQYRLLQRDDYDRGFLDILAQLTVVGNVSKE